MRELLGLSAKQCPFDLPVAGITTDSRKVQPGYLFLACRGSEAHGLVYLDQALERGAAAVAWEPGERYPQLETRVPSVAVANLGRQVGEIAARFYAQPSRELFVMGVTGTDGKTSCVHLAAQAAAHLGRRCGMLGTIGFGYLGELDPASHTTPDPVAMQCWMRRMVDSGADSLAMEVSSHALDQGRINGVALDVAIYTNLSRDHLDYHGDLRNYARAKRRLLELEGLKAVLVNVDDDQGRAWAKEFAVSRPVISYGIDQPAGGERFLRATELRRSPDGLAFTLVTESQRIDFACGLVGRFNVYNLLAVAGAWCAAGLPLDEVAAALARVTTVPGRLEAFRAAGQPLVIVDYAHTPAALIQALAAVAEHLPEGGKIITVMGCGGNRDAGKRPQMVAAAAARSALLVLTDDNPRYESPQEIMADMLEGLPANQDYVVIHDRATAIDHAIRRAGPQDLVLVAGKGHEDYQQIGAERRPFSDRRFVAQCLGQEDLACSA